jgi:hypothetical protein
MRIWFWMVSILWISGCDKLPSGPTGRVPVPPVPATAAIPDAGLNPVPTTSSSASERPETGADDDEPTPPIESNIAMRVLDVRVLRPGNTPRYFFDTMKTNDPQPTGDDYRRSRVTSWRNYAVFATIEAVNNTGRLLDLDGRGEDAFRVHGSVQLKGGSETYSSDFILMDGPYQPTMERGPYWTDDNSDSERYWRPGEPIRFTVSAATAGMVLADLQINAAEAFVRFDVKKFLGAMISSPTLPIEIPVDAFGARIVGVSYEDGRSGTGFLCGDRLITPDLVTGRVNLGTTPYPTTYWRSARPIPAEPELPAISTSAWAFRGTNITISPWPLESSLRRDRRLLRVTADVTLDLAAIDRAATAMAADRAAEPEYLADLRADLVADAAKGFECGAVTLVTSDRSLRSRNASALDAACRSRVAQSTTLTWEFEIGRYELPLGLVVGYSPDADSGRVFDMKTLASEALFAVDPR